MENDKENMKDSKYKEYTLDPREAWLIDMYRCFNKTGKAKVLDYIGDLADAPRNLS